MPAWRIRGPPAPGRTGSRPVRAPPTPVGTDASRHPRCLVRETGRLVRVVGRGSWVVNLTSTPTSPGDEFRASACPVVEARLAVGSSSMTRAPCLSMRSSFRILASEAPWQTSAFSPPRGARHSRSRSPTRKGLLGGAPRPHPMGLAMGGTSTPDQRSGFPGRDEQTRLSTRSPRTRMGRGDYRFRLRLHLL